jgi:hypothetical protein
MEFAEYLERMRPSLEGVARKHATSHPYLSADDLLQEALMWLWKVWGRHCGKPDDDLCKIGFVGAMRRITRTRLRAFSRGEGGAGKVDVVVRSDDGSEMDLFETLAADDAEQAFLGLALRELDGTLSEVSRQVLGEILAPGEATLRAVRSLWVQRKWKNINWRWIQPEVYAAALGLSAGEVKRSLKEIRENLTILRRCPSSREFQEMLHRAEAFNLEREDGMEGKKVFAPDPMDMGPVGPADLDLDVAEGGAAPPEAAAAPEAATGPGTDTAAAPKARRERKPRAPKAAPPAPAAEAPTPAPTAAPEAAKSAPKRERKARTPKAVKPKVAKAKKEAKGKAPKAPKAAKTERKRATNGKRGSIEAVKAILEPKLKGSGTVTIKDIHTAMNKAAGRELVRSSVGRVIWNLEHKDKFIKRAGRGSYIKR